MLPLALVRQSQGREGAAIERLRAPLASRSPVVPVSDSASGLFPFPEMARHDFSYLPLFVARLPFSVYTTGPRLLPGVPKRATNKLNRLPYPVLPILFLEVSPTKQAKASVAVADLRRAALPGFRIDRQAVLIALVAENQRLLPDAAPTESLEVGTRRGAIQDVIDPAISPCQHGFPLFRLQSRLRLVALGVKSHKQGTPTPARNLLPLLSFQPGL